MMGASVSPNFWNCSMESHTSKTETAPSTSMAQWNRRPGTLPKPAPACSSCLSTSSYTAGIKPVGRKYKPNAIDTLLTKMKRHDCSRDHKRIRVCGVVTFRTSINAAPDDESSRAPSSCRWTSRTEPDAADFRVRHVLRAPSPDLGVDLRPADAHHAVRTCAHHFRSEQCIEPDDGRG